MTNPYQAPEAPPKPSPPVREDRFTHINKIVRWSRSMVFAAFVVLALVGGDTESAWGTIRTVLMITAASIIGLSLFSTIPLCIWGFILGMRDARNSKKPWQ
ncbi:hypothetical protein [Rubritalea squalenifaciens]|nr:hypothetical protein [Rubritalea squalenifaciens]